MLQADTRVLGQCLSPDPVLRWGDAAVKCCHEYSQNIQILGVAGMTGNEGIF